ncbi:MAG: hypothetical protein HZA15_00515 [Nitrospirae bacterium]|nr:hypothetical protein [Nitrospirota bacterium]
MSYIVQALRKLEKERRRVTVTEMTLFRGLSERWQSESLVWRYLLVLSLLVNTGLAVWLLLFFSADRGNDPGKLNPQSVESSLPVRLETAVRPHQNHIYPDVPMKISLNVTPSQRVRTQPPGKALVSRHNLPPVSRQRGVERDGRHASKVIGYEAQATASADEVEMHEMGAHSSKNVLIWKDDKGNMHYSGVAAGK